MEITANEWSWMKELPLKARDSQNEKVKNLEEIRIMAA